MNYLLAGASVVIALVALVFVCLFRRLISPNGDAQPSLEWCNRFSIDRYRPMERLFSDTDFGFLAAQPGYAPQISKKLRAERRRVFRHYLRCLSRDFDRLHAAAKFLLLHSPQDQPELASALLRQRLVFRYALLAVHCRLALQGLGIGTVDVSGLVRALGGMRDQFQQLAAATEGTPA
jgi:hypothetical protein